MPSSRWDDMFKISDFFHEILSRILTFVSFLYTFTGKMHKPRVTFPKRFCGDHNKSYVRNKNSHYLLSSTI